MHKRQDNSEVINSVMKEAVEFYLDEFGDSLNQVWLFGSKARGEATVDSDLDVMVVVDKLGEMQNGYDAKRYDFALDILSRYDELISFMIEDENRFSDESTFRLYGNIKKEGVLYYEK